MNVDTGEVLQMTLEQVRELAEKGENWVEVGGDNMTSKQKERYDRQQQPVVDPRDNRSELGKIRVAKSKKLKEENRKKRKESKKAQRRNRKRK